MYEEFPGGPTVKDLASSQVWLSFDLWLENVHLQRSWPKQQQPERNGVYGSSLRFPWLPVLTQAVEEAGREPGPVEVAAPCEG